jgi:hypothetical protein
MLAWDKRGLGAKFVSSAKRHPGVDAKLAGFVGCGTNHAAFAPAPAHHHDLPHEGRVREAFTGNEERVHIEMGDQSWHAFIKTQKGEEYNRMPPGSVY